MFSRWRASTTTTSSPHQTNTKSEAPADYGDYVETLLPSVNDDEGGGIAKLAPRNVYDAVVAKRVPTSGDVAADAGAIILIASGLFREFLLMIGDAAQIARRRYDEEEKKLGVDVARAKLRRGGTVVAVLLLVMVVFQIARYANDASERAELMRSAASRFPAPPPPPVDGTGTWADSFMFPNLSGDQPLGYDAYDQGYGAGAGGGGKARRRFAKPTSEKSEAEKGKPPASRRTPRSSASTLPPVDGPLTHKHALAHAKSRSNLPEIGADGKRIADHHHMAAAGIWPSAGASGRTRAGRLQRNFLEGVAAHAKALNVPVVHHNLAGGPSFHAHVNRFLNNGIRDGSVLSHDGSAQSRGKLTMAGRPRTRTTRQPWAADKTAASVRRAATLEQAIRYHGPRAHQLHDAVGPIAPEGAGAVQISGQHLHIHPQWDTLNTRASRSLNPRTMRRNAVPLHAAPHYGGSVKDWHIVPGSQTDIKMQRRRSSGGEMRERGSVRERVRGQMKDQSSSARSEIRSSSAIARFRERKPHFD